MEVKILGTVSPYSTKLHNCPGYLVISNNHKYLLDCGSGISRYLNFPEDLNDLTIIISHYHQDHYSELLSLALTSYVYYNLGLLKKRIKVYLPEPDKNTINHYLYLKETCSLNYWQLFTFNSNTKLIDITNKITFSLNPHDIPSYAIKINSGKETLVYSGDTGYQNNTLTSFSKLSNLLICESTFLSQQKKKKDFHLYTHEAATIAKNAQVKELLLTHFWPEIPSDEYQKEAQIIFPNTITVPEGQKLTLKL